MAATGSWRASSADACSCTWRILGAIAAPLGVAVAVRIPLKIDVIRDRGELAREAEDGRIENAYRLQLMNTRSGQRRSVISAAGLDGLEVASEPELAMSRSTTQPSRCGCVRCSKTTPGSTVHRLQRYAWTVPVGERDEKSSSWSHPLERRRHP